MSESKELQFIEGLKRASEFRGMQLERSRIIKLLEVESLCKPSRPGAKEHDYNGSCYCDVIALIKGEQE